VKGGPSWKVLSPAELGANWGRSAVFSSFNKKKRAKKNILTRTLIMKTRAVAVINRGGGLSSFLSEDQVREKCKKGKATSFGAYTPSQEKRGRDICIAKQRKDGGEFRRGNERGNDIGRRQNLTRKTIKREDRGDLPPGGERGRKRGRSGGGEKENLRLRGGQKSLGICQPRTETKGEGVKTSLICRWRGEREAGESRCRPSIDGPKVGRLKIPT